MLENLGIIANLTSFANSPKVRKSDEPIESGITIKRKIKSIGLRGRTIDETYDFFVAKNEPIAYHNLQKTEDGVTYEQDFISIPAIYLKEIADENKMYVPIDASQVNFPDTKRYPVVLQLNRVPELEKVEVFAKNGQIPVVFTSNIRQILQKEDQYHSDLNVLLYELPENLTPEKYKTVGKLFAIVPSEIENPFVIEKNVEVAPSESEDMGTIFI